MGDVFSFKPPCFLKETWQTPVKRHGGSTMKSYQTRSKNQSAFGANKI